jgi:hypothetical protein
MYEEDQYDNVNSEPEIDMNAGYIPLEEMSDARSVSSLDTLGKKQLMYYDMVKSVDKCYHKLTRTMNGAKITIELYSTMCIPGTNIRNAASGSYLNYRCGTSDEFLFYKVGIATTEKGLGESSICFFDNPEQYERIMHTTVSQLEKEEWHLRFINEQVKRNKKY